MKMVKSKSICVTLNLYYQTRSFPVYLIPDNEKQFYDNLCEIGSFCITVFYDDGTIDTHITNSNDIKHVSDLKNNIKTTSILKAKDNIKYSQIVLAIVSCKMFRS